MARTDKYGCSKSDDECVIATMAERAADAEHALRVNAARIELTPRGTPSDRPKK